MTTGELELETRVAFADGSYTLGEVYASMSPSRRREDEYYRQIRPVRLEHACQMITAYGTGAITPVEAKQATLDFLEERVTTGEIDAEMAVVAKEEFELIQLAK